MRPRTAARTTWGSRGESHLQRSQPFQWCPPSPGLGTGVMNGAQRCRKTNFWSSGMLRFLPFWTVISFALRKESQLNACLRNPPKNAPPPPPECSGIEPSKIQSHKAHDKNLQVKKNNSQRYNGPFPLQEVDRTFLTSGFTGTRNLRHG